jgi:hypothetical protein
MECDGSIQNSHTVVPLLNKEARPGQHEEARLIPGVELKSLDAGVFNVAELSPQHIAPSLSRINLEKHFLVCGFDFESLFETVKTLLHIFLGILAGFE